MSLTIFLVIWIAGMVFLTFGVKFYEYLFDRPLATDEEDVFMLLATIILWPVMIPIGGGLALVVYIVYKLYCFVDNGAKNLARKTKERFKR